MCSLYIDSSVSFSLSLVSTLSSTVKPRFNDLRYNDIPVMTINVRLPSKSCSKMYGQTV